VGVEGVGKKRRMVGGGDYCRCLAYLRIKSCIGVLGSRSCFLICSMPS
jgi:hypothetical protein